jgi:hypothetical protein
MASAWLTKLMSTDVSISACLTYLIKTGMASAWLTK